MDYQMFLDWLVNERKMNTRSARDVVSRLKRVVNMLGSDNIDENTITILNGIEVFDNCSMFIKSQLRRSVSLYLEYSIYK